MLCPPTAEKANQRGRYRRDVPLHSSDVLRIAAHGVRSPADRNPLDREHFRRAVFCHKTSFPAAACVEAAGVSRPPAPQHRTVAPPEPVS